MTQLDDLLVDPPIVDCLRVDQQLCAFVVTFIPSDDLSCEPKLTITIPTDFVEGRQIQTWLRSMCVMSVEVIQGGCYADPHKVPH